MNNVPQKPEMRLAKQASAPSLLPRWRRALLLVLAWFCLVIGFVGLLVPGIPGAVFIILSAWAAMHGSPRLHDWLLAHRMFGPVIRDWRASGAVSRKAKWLASWGLFVCAGSLFLVPLPQVARLVGIACMAGVCWWLWQRPEPATKKPG
ncbi:MAG: YbaN family protein [Pseudomonadota bacterium]